MPCWCCRASVPNIIIDSKDNDDDDDDDDKDKDEEGEKETAAAAAGEADMPCVLPVRQPSTDSSDTSEHG